MTMQNKKAVIIFCIAAVIAGTGFQSCYKAEAQTLTPTMQSTVQSAALPAAQSETPAVTPPVPPLAGEPPVVYMTTNITPAGIMAIYNSLGLRATGKVAVKIHTGEPGNPHYLKPDLIKDIVQNVNGTIVECNTAGGVRRATAAAHYQVAKDHGFTAIAPVVILDESADIAFPVSGGKHLKENFVGARINEFDFQVVLSHFKGHPMGGFGGAIKNISIGFASSAGKSWIHSGGKTKNTGFRSADQNAFLESMAEAAKSIQDRYPGKMLYINVMNHLSVDCDCLSRPAPPTMADIGILGSLDPVALDKACVDLVYAARDSKDLVQRIESRNGMLTLDHAERMGVGSKAYRLVRIDG